METKTLYVAPNDWSLCLDNPEVIICQILWLESAEVAEFTRYILM